jgi:hypothetical protein
MWDADRIDCGSGGRDLCWKRFPGAYVAWRSPIAIDVLTRRSSPQRRLAPPANVIRVDTSRPSKTRSRCWYPTPLFRCLSTATSPRGERPYSLAVFSSRIARSLLNHALALPLHPHHRWPGPLCVATRARRRRTTGGAQIPVGHEDAASDSCAAANSGGPSPHRSDKRDMPIYRSQERRDTSAAQWLILTELPRCTSEPCSFC